eukprot:GDKI01018414.1.p1 GENE.GDKI01018414.1~~GDKI01018414.1.p1  ORF type:complete len:193 (-),score=28.57 GDKI01018414.1:29-607(-)
MSLQSYQLSRLKVIYEAKRMEELNTTIQNLKRTLAWAPKQFEAGPVPQRLPRRAWRTTYLKSPFKWKFAIRHNVFQDYRYAFSFHGVGDVRGTVSCALGSASENTWTTCKFAWHCQGQPPASGSTDLTLPNSAVADTNTPNTHTQPSPFPTLTPAQWNARALEEEQAIQRIQEKLDKKDRHWFNLRYKWPKI